MTSRSAVSVVQRCWRHVVKNAGKGHDGGVPADAKLGADDIHPVVGSDIHGNGGSGTTGNLFSGYGHLRHQGAQTQTDKSQEDG